jgi:3-phosphoshikimate 1-carboxyvinyltransferase
VENLHLLGVEAEELDDGLVVQGGAKPLSGRVNTHGDHRIAMAFAVLGALGRNHIVVDDPGAADVSFPGFWTLLEEVAGGFSR